MMADVLRRAGVRDRKVWLFDSFEGLPAPEAIDGPAAATYVASAKSPWYFDNSRASLEEVRAAAVALGLETYIECVKGWVEETLPAHRGRIGTIALLRIDTDWLAAFAVPAMAAHSAMTATSAATVK